MQRRAAASSSRTSRSSSFQSKNNDDNDKIKRKKFPTSMLLVVVCLILVGLCLPSILTPSEKKQLQDIEHGVEDWWMHRQHSIVTDDKTESNVQQENSEPIPSDSDSGSADAATARMEAQSSRWVDGEKKLKEKLKVLYDLQEKGKYLGVPVLTRYLGEDVPAYVGTPDSTMEEAEWRELVKAKYEEMRVEEEEWKKKMAAFIEARNRDTGITTP